LAPSAAAGRGERRARTPRRSVYADYLPAAHEADLVDRAFAHWGPNLSKTALDQDEVDRLDMGNLS
jgi:hypothetical protein